MVVRRQSPEGRWLPLTTPMTSRGDVWHLRTGIEYRCSWCLEIGRYLMGLAVNPVGSSCVTSQADTARSQIGAYFSEDPNQSHGWTIPVAGDCFLRSVSITLAYSQVIFISTRSNRLFSNYLECTVTVGMLKYARSVSQRTFVLRILR